MYFLKKLLSLSGNAASKKFQDQEKPFLDHLEDLRGTLFKTILTLVISTVVAFVFYKELIEIVKYPIIKANEGGSADFDTSLSVFSPVEGFMSVIKICLYAGLISSFPLLLYFIGEFVIPGLNKKERKLIIPVVFASFLLFATGVLFAYFVVIPRALEFFYTFNSGVAITTDLRFKYTVSFVTMLCLVFGLCFELPVVVLTLVKLGLLDSKMMRATRSYAIVAMFVLAAVITPTPDIFTMSLLAGPMVLLYEICIWLAWFMERKEAKRETAEKERERELLIAQIKAEKETQEKEGNSASKPSEETETLEYDPDNAVVYEDQNSDTAETSEESAAFDEYHSGLDEHSEPIDPKSDAVWGYSDEAKGGTVPEEAETYHDDHGHHDDHGYYSDGYYSGPTEELKRILHEELREDIKQEIIQEIKLEIKNELKEELLKEFSDTKNQEDSDQNN